MEESLFKKAKRADISLKVAIIGASGSGKTFTALTLAKGFGGSTGVLDTENKRALHYADRFDFMHLVMDAPFRPDRFIKVIEIAQKEGINNLIVDSTSHEWIGKGGCLDMHSQIPGNSYVAWNKITPQHTAFVQAIVDSPINIICCMRGKDEYVLEEDDKGKKVPRKLGIGAQQRDGLEYDMVCSFILDQQHLATCMKDTTGLFDGNGIKILTEQDGVNLAKWGRGE